MTVLGLEDPGIWLAYLLCIGSAVFCVLYGIANWSKADESIRPEDIKWVQDEKQVKENL